MPRKDVTGRRAVGVGGGVSCSGRRRQAGSPAHRCGDVSAARALCCKLAAAGPEAGAAADKAPGAGAAGDAVRRPRRRRVWMLVAACWLAISLLGLVALLQLMAPSGDRDDDVDTETHPHDGRRADIDGPPVADVVAVRSYRTQSCGIQPTCQVTCQNMKGEHLSSSISELLENHKDCTSSMILGVSNVEFANSTLAAGWLNVRATLSSLTLSNCPIEVFHDDAFNTSQFANLETLILSGLPLKKLQIAALRPLRNVGTLSLDDCHALQEVDPKVTDVLPKLWSLQVLRTIYSSNRQILPAFAGTTAIVDLKLNELGTLRPEDVGVTAVSAATLNLEMSGIEDVLVGTFPTSTNRQLLTLNNNKLTTLRNMSISFENHHAYFKIYLAGNPWNCDCSLLWLLPHVSTIADRPICSSPQHFTGWSLTSALDQLKESCAISSTLLPPSTAPETTESSITVTSEPIGTSASATAETGPTANDESTPLSTSDHSSTTTPDNTSELPTTSSQSSTPFSTSEAPTTTHAATDSTFTTAKIPTSPLPDERPDDLKLCYHVEFSEHYVMEDWRKDSVLIHDIDECTLKILVPYSVAGGFMVWKEADTADCYETSPLNSPTVVLENLKPEVDYNICVLRPEETRTSIHNCHPHRTMAEYTKRTWLSNGDVPFAAGITAIGSIVVTILSAGIAVFLVRRHPTWIFHDVWEMDKTTVIQRRPNVPDRRLSFPSWWPPPPPPNPRRPSSSQSTGSGSYINVEPPASPVQLVARFLRRSSGSVRRMFQRQDGASRQSSSPPSARSSHSGSRPSTSSSNCSVCTHSTNTTISEDIYAGRQ
ncbi:leucine-rich repeat and fibronectin type-III domain-containing protein 5-like [Schistocerca nitens]|uniref:leucine-rich repeat and fibronectin type-III domain-containing protein 5-like n=1 Tax=Schistocerca nitens TaxID=7011 RepID=UPI0021182748|nr:leucine-rich repeat and fibronectin type-III domain-containing protein 5-like [Schistocerca nitens]